MNFELYNGDCLVELKKLPDNSIDSCVTDPPYGLSFMGKSWDHDVPSADIWREVHRVLKPGGHLLAFFGSRTYHRGVIQIEDAGFEIRDQIMWLYGSGFPKSHNIGSHIDKQERGCPQGSSDPDSLNHGKYHTEGDQHGAGASKWMKDTYNKKKTELSENANKWKGWGTALKPAHEPIVVARKPIEEKNIAANVLKHGTGAINIDESRVGEGGKKRTKPRGGIWKTDSDAKAELVDNPLGRWPANIIHDGSDEVTEGFPESNSARIGNANNPKRGTNHTPTSWNMTDGKETHDYRDSGSASRFFYCAKASKSDRDEGLEQFLAKKIITFQTGDGGSGKASSLSAGRDTEYKNNHPTVKPTDLMKYLVKLTTQKGGTVLDPFMGSGTTGKACGFEGFKFIGIERDKDYFEIAKARIEHAYQNKTVNLENFFV